MAFYITIFYNNLICSIKNNGLYYIINKKNIITVENNCVNLFTKSIFSNDLPIENVSQTIAIASQP